MNALYHLFRSKSSFPSYGTRLLTKRTKCSFCFNGDNLENQAVKEGKIIMETEPEMKKRLHYIICNPSSERLSYGEDGISSASQKILVDSKDSNKPYRVDDNKVFAIRDFLGYVNMQLGIPSNISKDHSNSTGLSRENSMHSISQRFENNSILKTGKRIEENKVFIRFLSEVLTKSRILKGFDDCGDIMYIDFPNLHRTSNYFPLFRDAFIYFKTGEGVEKALKKNGMILGNGVIVVESANYSMETTTTITPKKIPIPSLVGDPAVPAALVKNPTRTIKIQNLSHEISSHHVKEALAFCETSISGYFVGSSDSSVSYVEFETEVGKERALCRHSINVLGRNLIMLRIDVPRTTVVRISIGESLPKMNSILSVCGSLGKVMSFCSRCPHVVDINFGLEEWPNMLNILNRLNGFEVEGRRLRAEPAAIFPPDVLLALRDQPEERMFLKKALQDLLQLSSENGTKPYEIAHQAKIILENRMWDQQAFKVDG